MIHGGCLNQTDFFIQPRGAARKTRRGELLLVDPFGGVLGEQRLDRSGRRRGAGVALGPARLKRRSASWFLRHAVALCMTHAEVIERVQVTLRRAEAPPPHGFLVRLFNAQAVVEHHAEVRLRTRKALLGCASVPLHGGLVVDHDAFPMTITRSL